LNLRKYSGAFYYLTNFVGLRLKSGDQTNFLQPITHLSKQSFNPQNNLEVPKQATLYLLGIQSAVLAESDKK